MKGIKMSSNKIDINMTEVISLLNEKYNKKKGIDSEILEIISLLNEKYNKRKGIEKMTTVENCEGSCENNCPGTCTCANNPYDIAKKLITDRQLSGNRMGINDDICNTNLISKNYSPMFVRKFNASELYNWPLYVSMICDEDVSDIDAVVNGALKAFDEAGLISNNLQSMRNLTGIISETVSKHYNNKKHNCVEGIAITLYIDKAYIQSFTGDYMNHAQCRSEYTSALQMMTQI
jgi:uncharacterized protein (UPF0332 family)